MAGSVGGQGALSLVLLSAFIHPIWNMLLKQSRDKVIFYFNIHLFFTIIGSFLIIRYPLSGLSGSCWSIVLLSSAAHFFYQLYLCRSYELGELSLTYPILRSAPFFVAALGFIFLGERLSPVGLLGILLTVAGAQLINQKRFSFLPVRISDLNHKAAFKAAVLTAFFSAIYSIVDKKGVLEMHPVLFFYLFFAISGLFFGIYLACSKQRRKNYWALTRRESHKIAAASLMEFASYVLILYAFTMSKVAVVVGVRQISVVFGSVLGILILKERYGRIKIAASLLIFAGIYLLAVYR